ncbi:MAG: hypothetical protein AAFW68_01635 [Pseudomonadota bacterium]
MQTAKTTRPNDASIGADELAAGNLSAEIKQLREDLKALKADFTSLTTTAADEAKTVFQEKLSIAEEKVSDAVETGADELQEIQRQTEKAVRKNPLTAMAAAAAIGYFLAGITRR